jgi:uncharacterized protein with ParB-like and HNH nuclease domain
MKAGKYSVKELFVNRYVQQIIIPEIQRDYVWKDEQVIGLLDSIKKDYDKFKTVNVPKITPTDNELEIAFEIFYKKRNNGSNIGFIYAYNDDQYSGKYFLIDGQQRITTIFLMLLVLAYKNEQIKEKFIKTYFADNILKLDYKVRESAHHFLEEFVNQALKKETDFIDQNWYFRNKYDSDTTIKNLLANFSVIQEFYQNKLPEDLESFYDYVESFVEFWYFDTNISEQGEELYIYMNARGEQMQANENIKADLLSELDNIEDKNKYGKLWEDWQDYFWINRGGNDNADNGFNTFLSWCQLLKSIENRYEKNVELSTEEIEDFADFIRGKKTLNFKLIKLSILDIELYFNSVVYYFGNYSSFTKSILVYKNLIDKKWLTGNLSQIDHFRLLPLIYFIKKHKLYDKKDFETIELIKLNRLFFNLRLDETIGKTAATQTIYGIKFINELSKDFKFDDLLEYEDDYKSIFNGEEVLKLKVIISISDSVNKEKTRKYFCDVEDNKLLRGKIAHVILVALEIENPDFNVDVFVKVWNKYSDFLNNESSIKSELIASNSFIQIGNRIKLYDDWFKREHILDLLKDYYAFNGTYQDFIESKQSNFLSKYSDCKELKSEEMPKEQLYIYYLLSKELDINWDWSKGKNIGVYYGGKELNSVFDRKLFFQHYNTQWHDNDGRIIDIQKQKIKDIDLVNLLKQSTDAQ